MATRQEPAKIIYTRLTNGAWGIWAKGQGELTEGTKVWVEKRNGNQDQVIVGKRSPSAAGVFLYELGKPEIIDHAATANNVRSIDAEWESTK